MSKISLHWQIIIGLVLGVLWALLSSYMGWAEFTSAWIDPWGAIFINLLKLIAVPLVLFSIIKGITDISDVSRLGRMGGKTLGAYLLTTVLAITVGLAVVNIIKPGTFLTEDQRIDNRIQYELWAQENDKTIVDNKSFLSNPDHADRVARIKGVQEVVAENAEVEKKQEAAEKTKARGPLAFVVDMVPSNIFTSLNNNGLMLQVIFFAIFFGISILLLPTDKTQPLIQVVSSLNEVFLKMVDIVMKGAPFFVFALLAGKMSDLAGNDPQRVVDIFINLGWYSLVVVIGLALLVFVLYPLFVYFGTGRRISYSFFFKSIAPAQLLAFSSSSSAATLPVTLECVNDNLKVSKDVSSFVLPIGATVNMDGTSLYQAVAVVFLAQFHMLDLSMAQQATIVLTATLASIGSAAVPSAGLIMLIIVLESVGLNPAWIGIILPVDRILDMCRTVVNVTGDATVSSVVAHSENELNLKKS